MNLTLPCYLVTQPPQPTLGKALAPGHAALDVLLYVHCTNAKCDIGSGEESSFPFQYGGKVPRPYGFC